MNEKNTVLNPNIDETKIFVIGLNKTGTTSLGRALEILGYDRHKTYDLELTRAWSEGNFEPLFAVADRHNNLEDWPWPMTYEEMYARYPNAKFILSTRSSPEVWFQSLCKHALRIGPSEYEKIIYGHYMPHDFEDEYLAFYEEHNQSVLDFFASKNPTKLLEFCIEKDHGWEKLCTFLDQPTPSEVFPNLNRAQDYDPSKRLEVRNPLLIKIIQIGRKIKGIFRSQ